MRLAGAVLAGGKSLRMGVDKGRLRRDGMSLAGHLLTEMALAGLAPLSFSASAAPPDLPEGVRLVPDEREGLGPMGGLASLLRGTDRPVLVAAVDMPGVNAAVIRALAEAYRRIQGPGLVARAADGWHPLLAVYAPSILPAMDAALADGRRALHRLVEAEGLPAWTPPGSAVLINLNSPEDRRSWEAEHGKLEGP